MHTTPFLCVSSLRLWECGLLPSGSIWRIRFQLAVGPCSYSFAVGAFPLIIWRLVANILKRLPGAFLAGGVLSDGRRGKNTRHLLTGLFRQSVFGRLAGYEDVNDADRLAHDPAMRAIVDRGGLDRVAASTSQMGRFETVRLSSEANLASLADLSGARIDRVPECKPQTTIVLDMEQCQ
jgi:Transposase DDE domain group 1